MNWALHGDLPEANGTRQQYCGAMAEVAQSTAAALEQTYAASWRMPVVAIYGGHFFPVFRVPGRRRDGTLRSQDRGRRAWRAARSLLLMPFRLAWWLVLFVLDAITGGSGPDLPGGGETRLGTVRGADGSVAMQFAQIVGNHHYWLVWSPARTAILLGYPVPHQQASWIEPGPTCGAFDAQSTTFSWGDGSTVRLVVRDRKRLAEFARRFNL